VAYSGEGVSLGGGGAQTEGLMINKNVGKPSVDSEKPKTKINFRFHNGERATVEFNLAQ
jgi:hypothetical protein